MSNAAEYERKRDAITDLKEQFKAKKNEHRIILAAGVIGLLIIAGCFMLLNHFGQGYVLPNVLIGIFIPVDFFVWVVYFALRNEREPDMKKHIRDAEREFKYWSIENPPC